MRVTRLVLLSGILGFACASSPALAGCDGAPWQCFWQAACDGAPWPCFWQAGCDGAPGPCFWREHHAIYHMENRIVFLQADPVADDGTKGPVIDHMHRKILRIRALVGMRWPHYPTPCCYSRRPIYIR